MLLFSCISFSSCEKEGEKDGNSNSLKNEIKDVWNDSHGTKITIQGKQITLPPNDEIWMWVTEHLAKDIIENNDATIVEACDEEVLSYKLYNDNGQYVLCIKLANTIEEFESSLIGSDGIPLIKFDKTIELHKTGYYWYNDATNLGIKKIAFPLNTAQIVLSQEFGETDSLDDFLEEVYFGNKTINVELYLPALKNIYLTEHPIEYEGSTHYYRDNYYPRELSLSTFNMEFLEIPEGWTIEIESKTLKTLTLNSKGALSHNDGYDHSINCPKLEKLVLNDDIRQITCDISCPSLKTFELPEELLWLDSNIECDIESLTIPKNVNYIIAETFGNIKSLYFKPATPPSIGGGLEDTLRYFDVTIYVPSESYNDYMKKDFFKNLNTVPYEF